MAEAPQYLLIDALSLEGFCRQACMQGVHGRQMFLAGAGSDCLHQLMQGSVGWLALAVQKVYR